MLHGAGLDKDHNVNKVDRNSGVKEAKKTNKA